MRCLTAATADHVAELVNAQLCARTELSNAAHGIVRTRLLLAQPDLVGYVERLALIERDLDESPHSPQAALLHSAEVAVVFASVVGAGAPAAWRRQALSIPAALNQPAPETDFWALATYRAIRTDLSLVRRANEASTDSRSSIGASRSTL